jgi:hypothetical protein
MLAGVLVEHVGGLDGEDGLISVSIGHRKLRCAGITGDLRVGDGRRDSSVGIWLD